MLQQLFALLLELIFDFNKLIYLLSFWQFILLCLWNIFFKILSKYNWKVSLDAMQGINLSLIWAQLKFNEVMALIFPLNEVQPALSVGTEIDKVNQWNHKRRRTTPSQYSRAN